MKLSFFVFVHSHNINYDSYMMKIFLAQQNYHIGNIEENTNKIISAIQHTHEQGGDLILFPELAVCGYSPRDLLEFEDFLAQCYAAIERIKPYTQEIAVVVGCPSPNPVVEGKDLFNSAYFIHEGEVKAVINKTLLPNYDVFDEYRYFESTDEHQVVTFKGKKLAITICEDIWDVEENPLYKYTPMDRLAAQHPDVILNLSASPFSYAHADNRKRIIKRNVLKYNIPLLYCNTVGSHTEIVFDGGSLVFDKYGNIVKELPYFEEALTHVTIDDDNEIVGENIIIAATAINDDYANPIIYDAEDNIPHIHQALVMGIREYFSKMCFKQAIIASSGGIDSALTLALACEALGSENVFALLMPSQYSTNHSVDDAVALSKNLNNPYEIVAIKDIFHQVATDLQPIFKDLPFNVAEENIQSRIRGLLAMALSNKFNYILLNTSNKSELATGYGTLYGDMAGGLGVLGDLYKNQVYALARYINRNGTIIPEHIITKAPSAELRPDQKDSDSLPEYDLLDAILYQYIDRRQGTKQIIAMGYDEATVKRIIRMVNNNEYKRNQFCPIIRVSTKSFGIGRRIPIVAKYSI